ncbi:MAG: hypothetical protein ACRDVC_06380 [Acidimicrobiales bacterium]
MRLVRACAVVTVTAIIAAVTIATASGASPVLKAADVAGYRGALVNSSSWSLYILTTEKGAQVKCRAECLKTWPPLLVSKSITTVALGAHVQGKIGFVARSATMKQVTYNSYPLYTYVGDLGPKHDQGQDFVSDGGTWYLVRARATSAKATPYKSSS